MCGGLGGGWVCGVGEWRARGAERRGGGREGRGGASSMQQTQYAEICRKM